MRTRVSILNSSIFLIASAMAAAQSASTTVNIRVANQIKSVTGINGRLQLGMSTSFQLTSQSYRFFDVYPATLPPLNTLNPRHTRVQVVSDAMPLTAANTWNFTDLESFLPPIQAAGDHSPQLQVAGAPAFMNDSSGHILPSSFSAFAQMCANLVRYFNTGGFDTSGVHYQSLSPYPITWWGIFNEPNGTGVSAQDYVNLYNTVVPVMAQADPTIKFAALELSDFGNMASGYMPAFVAGVKAPVDVLATHFYSSCNQKDLDISVFSTVPQFASEVRYIYSQLATNPALATVPVWVTENNVDADFNIGNGTSSCNPGLPYNPDPRGTSAFFAAWRALVFTQLGEAGAQALYQWSFGTDPQFGEVDATGKPYLSYWVDYYLSHWLPSPPGQDILQTTQSGCCLWINNNIILGLDTTTEALRNPDGSVVVLMSNHAVQTPRKDNNAAGVTRTFALDLSALGNFNTATLVTLNASTPSTGPVPSAMTPAPQMQITLPGYGAALLRLSNTQPTLRAGNVANAASYVSGVVAPGEIIALFGSSLGPPSPAFLSLTNPHLVANSLAGVRVLFDGLPAPVLYASGSQVNAVVPFSVAGHTSTQLQVEYLGATTASLSIPVSATAPGIFTLDASGKGQGAILNAKDESVNSLANPASAGDYVVLFATGAGSTNPASVDGWVSAPPLPVPNADVTVMIGGIPCHTNFVGAAPGFVAGLLQINAQVPEAVTPGPAVPVEVSVGGVSAQTGVTLALR